MIIHPPFRPLLPTADKLFPYLQRIDKSRIYSNFGELNNEYKSRLGDFFNASVETGSSATSLLTATLIALNLPPKSFIACPSWTFVASPASIVAAGHIPYFMDCTKEGILSAESNIMKQCAAIMLVSPCGAPLNIKQWEKNAAHWGIPLVIDAAAGFDAFSTVSLPQKSPVIISTHATKAFATAEGGFVVCKDSSLLERIRRLTNFGLTPKRDAETYGMNAKMSEYHAAIGLAELDGWEEKRDRYLRKTLIYNLKYATSLVPQRTPEGRKNVYGCHKLFAYKYFPKTPLPNTEKLMKEMSFISVTL